MIDLRLKRQTIPVLDKDVYVWIYRDKNYIAYGINGTSIHLCLDEYKKYRKEEIEDIIYNSVADRLIKKRGIKK